MKREIKFRAWYDSKMYEVFEYNSDGTVRISLPRFPFTQIVIPEAVVQYTGLKDKNGKEIYEWDIVKTHYWEKQPNGSTICSDKYKRFTNKVIEYHTKVPFIGYRIHEHFEIIGNIYENPELFKTI